jgi:hypothetical protein
VENRFMAEESPKLFSLRVVGEGINVEKQIDQRAVLQVLQVVMGGGTPTITSPLSAGLKGEARPADGVTLSLREHLDKIGASKKPDQITTIAHYVSQHEGQRDFSRDDIRSRFLTAREPLPRNFGRDFAVALKNGWIAEVHGKKNRFYVTAKGTQAINDSFSNGKGAVARRKVGGALKAAKPMEDSATNKRSAGNSISRKLEAWLEDGYFNTPRTLRVVHERLHEQGVIARQTAISGPLLKAVQQGRMTRGKISENGKEVWVYRVAGA